jgi:hypothetical protein
MTDHCWHDDEREHFGSLVGDGVVCCHCGNRAVKKKIPPEGHGWNIPQDKYVDSGQLVWERDGEPVDTVCHST